MYECTLLTVYKVVQFGQCLQTIHLFGQTLLGADNFALVYLSSLSANIQVVGPNHVPSTTAPHDYKYCKGALEHNNMNLVLLDPVCIGLEHTNKSIRDANINLTPF